MKKNNYPIKSILLLMLAGTVSISSCTDDEPSAPATTKTSGYVATAITYNTSNSSYFAGYFDGLPSGTIDMTSKKAFTYIHPITSYKNAFYSNPLDGTFGLTKVAVDVNGDILAQATIPLASYLAGVKILNDNLGIYSQWSAPGKIFTFDPATMTNTGEIDMTGAKVIAENDNNTYYVFAYRPQDNRLFAALYTNKSGTSQYYDATSVYVEVINLTTKKREKTAELANTMDLYCRGSLNEVVDETGNIYFLAQGSYGLDGNVGASAPAYTKPKLLKIPAGSTDFDESYSFNPVTAFNAGLSELLVQLAAGIVYGKDGIAYACISAKAYDDPRIYELIQKYVDGTITSTEIAELYQLVIYSPGLKWVKIDLNTKAVTEISGMTFTAGFSYPNSYNYDGKIYLQMLNEDEGVNGFYEFDPSTGTAKSIYNLSSGGVAVGLVKLTE